LPCDLEGNERLLGLRTGRPHILEVIAKFCNLIFILTIKNRLALEASRQVA
jgi:hypothetical protein